MKVPSVTRRRLALLPVLLSGALLGKKKEKKKEPSGKNRVCVTEKPQNGAIWGRDRLASASVSVWTGPARRGTALRSGLPNAPSAQINNNNNNLAGAQSRGSSSGTGRMFHKQCELIVLSIRGCFSRRALEPWTCPCPRPQTSK